MAAIHETYLALPDAQRQGWLDKNVPKEKHRQFRNTASRASKRKAKAAPAEQQAIDRVAEIAKAAKQPILATHSLDENRLAITQSAVPPPGVNQFLGDLTAANVALEIPGDSVALVRGAAKKVPPGHPTGGRVIGTGIRAQESEGAISPGRKLEHERALRKINANLAQAEALPEPDIPAPLEDLALPVRAIRDMAKPGSDVDQAVVRQQASYARSRHRFRLRTDPEYAAQVHAASQAFVTKQDAVATAKQSLADRTRKIAAERAGSNDPHNVTRPVGLGEGAVLRVRESDIPESDPLAGRKMLWDIQPTQQGRRLKSIENLARGIGEAHPERAGRHLGNALENLGGVEHESGSEMVHPSSSDAPAEIGGLPAWTPPEHSGMAQFLTATRQDPTIAQARIHARVAGAHANHPVVRALLEDPENLGAMATGAGVTHTGTHFSIGKGARSAFRQLNANRRMQDVVGVPTDVWHSRQQAAQQAQAPSPSDPYQAVVDAATHDVRRSIMETLQHRAVGTSLLPTVAGTGNNASEMSRVQAEAATQAAVAAARSRGTIGAAPRPVAPPPSGEHVIYQENAQEAHENEKASWGPSRWGGY